MVRNLYLLNLQKLKGFFTDGYIKSQATFIKSDVDTNGNSHMMTSANSDKWDTI